MLQSEQAGRQCERGVSQSTEWTKEEGGEVEQRSQPCGDAGIRRLYGRRRNEGITSGKPGICGCCAHAILEDEGGLGKDKRGAYLPPWGSLTLLLSHACWVLVCLCVCVRVVVVGVSVPVPRRYPLL
jgi:hypothetical protein